MQLTPRTLSAHEQRLQPTHRRRIVAYGCCGGEHEACRRPTVNYIVDDPARYQRHSATDFVCASAVVRDYGNVETLCCTSKYRKLFDLPNNLPAAAGSTTALGPWYANVLNIGSVRLLHYMSSTSLLSVVIWQRERKSAEQRFVRGVEQLLAALNVPANFIQAELDHFASLQYARATDRSVLGSMRDQAVGASYYFDDTITPADLSRRLAATPCGPKSYEAPEKLAPRLIHAKWSGPRRGEGPGRTA